MMDFMRDLSILIAQIPDSPPTTPRHVAPPQKKIDPTVQVTVGERGDSVLQELDRATLQALREMQISKKRLDEATAEKLSVLMSNPSSNNVPQNLQQIITTTESDYAMKKSAYEDMQRQLNTYRTTLHKVPETSSS